MILPGPYEFLGSVALNDRNGPFRGKKEGIYMYI